MTPSVAPLELFINVLALILLVLPFIGVMATSFLWFLWLQDTARPRSWVLQLLATTGTIATITAFVVSVLAWVRLSGQSLGEIGGVVLVVAVLANEVIPVLSAVVVFIRRRGFGIGNHDSSLD